jgi:hypothetical protein
MGKAERFGRTCNYWMMTVWQLQRQLFDHVVYPKSTPYAKGERHRPFWLPTATASM